MHFGRSLFIHKAEGGWPYVMLWSCIPFVLLVGHKQTLFDGGVLVHQVGWQLLLDAMNVFECFYFWAWAVSKEF